MKINDEHHRNFIEKQPARNIKYPVWQSGIFYSFYSERKTCLNEIFGLAGTFLQFRNKVMLTNTL